MKALRRFFDKARSPAAPAAADIPVNRETLSNFYNGLYIALPDDALEQVAIEHYCFLLYAFRAMPEIGPAGIEKILDVRRTLFDLISDGERNLLPDYQIDKRKVVELLLAHEDAIATVYNGLQTSWADLSAKAGFAPNSYTLYREANAPVWQHMRDNEQHRHMYQTGIETFMRVFEKLPSLRQALTAAPPATPKLGRE